MAAIDRVIVDYGHGGMIDGEYQTPGAKQYNFTEPEEFTIYEGVFNRGTASKFMSLLVRAGVETYDCVSGKYVVDSIDTLSLEQADISLSQRVANANRENKSGSTIFVSIHANAIGMDIKGPSLNVRGASVFVYRASGLSGDIARNLIAEYGNTQLRPRNVVENQSFYVLRKTAMPALLSENGFFVNIDEAKYLMSEAGQWDIARAHYDSIKDLLGIAPNIV